MSIKFESTVRQINAPQEKVYEMLSNLQNLERVRDRLPEDKLQGLEFDSDSVSVEAPMVGRLALQVVEREEPKTIKFEAEGSPVPVNFWIQILPVEETTAKMKLTIKADIPFANRRSRQEQRVCYIAQARLGRGRCRTRKRACFHRKQAV